MRSLSSVNNIDDLLVESYASQPASLRIAVVTETFPPEVNGVAMTLGRIVEGVLRRGHMVQVVRPRQAREADALAWDGLDQVLSKGIPLPTYGELRFGLPSKNRLIRLWREQRPDVVHVVTEGPLGWSAVAAARALQLPVTSSFHTNFHSYSRHYGMGLLKTPIDSYLRKLHNRTLATMVPTRAMQQSLEARGYKNVTLLSRGVATDLFSPSKRSQDLRASWGLQADDLAVLHVGRLAKEKNVGVMVAAFRAVQERLPTAKLIVVGDGPLRAALQAACPDGVFVGLRRGEELARYYASSDMFLFPSVTETFGNVVPEALASGLGVVSFDQAAAAELIHHGENGVLVRPVEETEFVQAAVQLALNPVLQAHIKERAPQAVAHMAWDAIFDTFVGTLSRVLERHGHQLSSAPWSSMRTVSQPSA